MTLADEIRERLRTDTIFYAEHVVKIVDKRAKTVPLIANRAQRKLDAALEDQRRAGKPMRVIVLKSRKVGISTWTQVKLMQRATMNQNRRALVVAQDNETAGELFDIGQLAYNYLPDDPLVKPDVVSSANSKGGRKYIHWGNKAAGARRSGELGVNSSLTVDTAKEVEAGRGKTITELHASEIGFWNDPRKALSLLNAVPDEPETLIVLESTANGHNFFKARWDRAVRGEGSFAPVFIGWTEDESCQRAFDTPEQRAAFIETVGTGPWGDEEPRLVEKFGATPEQLNWRRYTIVDKCDGNLDLFHQEYPNEPQDAFIGSGKVVFSSLFVKQARDRAEHVAALKPEDGGPAQGILVPSGLRKRSLAFSEIEVPTGTLWTPRAATGFRDNHPWWTIWEHPVNAKSQAALPEEERKPDGQYVIAADVAGDEEATTTGDRAFHAVQVIDHRTREQVAEFEARMDPDEFARELFLCGLYFNEGWLAVETTGGWGIPVVKKLWKEYGYRRLYTRVAVESKREKQQDRLGWSTDRRTKPLIEAGMHQALREGTHGIRSVGLVGQLETYVKDERGQHGPDTDCFSDRLMAYMIGQQVCEEKPIRVPRGRGERHSTLTRDLRGSW